MSETEVSSEIYWLTLTAAFTATLALPYVINIMAKQYPLIGLGLLRRPPEPGADRYAWKWGARAFGAHMNAIENLVVFAPLAIIVHLTGSGNEVTALACQVYFWARLIHAPFYIFNTPYIRPFSWTIGLLATLTLAYQLIV